TVVGTSSISQSPLIASLPEATLPRIVSRLRRDLRGRSDTAWRGDRPRRALAARSESPAGSAYLARRAARGRWRRIADRGDRPFRRSNRRENFRNRPASRAGW